MRVLIFFAAICMFFSSFGQVLDTPTLEQVNVTFEKQTEISQTKAMVSPDYKLAEHQDNLNIISVFAEKYLKPQAIKTTASLSTNKNSSMLIDDLPLITIISIPSMYQSNVTAKATFVDD